MSLVPGVVRRCRRLAWRAGLASDGLARAVDKVAEHLDTRGREYFEQSGVPGLAVVVRFAAGPRVCRYLGSADANLVVSERTVFQVLSMSKPVAAMCAMALVERGMLDLDEPIWPRLRSWMLPPHRCGGRNPAGVTLRRILSHSAGLNIHGYDWARPDARAEDVPAPGDLLRAEGEDEQTLRLTGPPGPMVYSGGGYLLLQFLIEEVTGRTFPDAARELVLRPMGMRSSDFACTHAIAANLATRHDGENRPLPPGRILATASSGLYSTAADLAEFWASVLPRRSGEEPARCAVSPASARDMISPQASSETNRLCGMGFFLWRKRSDTEYLHLGYKTGWWGRAEGLVRRRVVCVALTNGDRGEACVKPLVATLRQLLYDHVL